MTAWNALSLLPAADWLALALFFAGWAGYARFARRRAAVRPSVLAATNRIRRQWMLQATRRDTRIVDGAVLNSLTGSPSFFASTTILILGGLLALLGASDKAGELVGELPFAVRSSALVMELKLLLLGGIFIYAFFRFTWSIRQYTFGALLIGACPDSAQFADEAERERFADRAGRVMGLAAEAFNHGLRAYYMAFATLGWFLSPWALVAGTAAVITVLYLREFRSEVLDALG
ncbi:DUF599 domain-containing protein [Aquabacterium sp. J223]|uniref:DUF599 domain-containing protein n=1 Tax=Aquabacterium sp. J223 TaxID=2898431 RepID=UPI0021AD8C3A|nr:DUF599 domain-containing protein [Aquabacterium sp. J223]UUX97495.1 DUF599 domain-containing protein [Aquabacterium sp. J223]